MGYEARNWFAGVTGGGGKRLSKPTTRQSSSGGTTYFFRSRGSNRGTLVNRRGGSGRP